MTDGSRRSGDPDRGSTPPVERAADHARPAARSSDAGKRPDIGDLHVATVVLNVQDMERAVAFWSAALGYRPREPRWDPRFMMLVDPAGRGLPVSLQITDHPPREPLRGHIDLYTRERHRHVERLVDLGASRVPDWTYPADPDFVVLRDPDGNEFCVIDHDPL